MLLETQIGDLGTALAMRTLGAGVWGRGWKFNAKTRQLYAQESDPVNIVHEAQWDPGPVWRGPENLAPHWVSNPKPSKPQPV